jgi:hypothetical protein
VSRVDLHLHLLPGVDDGAPDEATAVAHAARMAAGGVHVATVTPHVGSPFFDVELASIPDRCAALQQTLHREGIALRLRPGGEIHPAAMAEAAAAPVASPAQIVQLTRSNPRFLLEHGLPREHVSLPTRGGVSRDAMAQARAAARRLSAAT